MTNAEEIKKIATEKFGFLPNMIAGLADTNPTVAEFYLNGSGILGGGSLSEKERQAAFLAISSVNGCKYCMTAHGLIGVGAGLSEEDIKAIHAGKDTSDEGINNLVAAARLLLDKRGWLSDETQAELSSKGIDKSKLLELIGLIGLKTVSNYFNHINHTPVDEAFAASPLAGDCSEEKSTSCCASATSCC